MARRVRFAFGLYYVLVLYINHDHFGEKHRETLTTLNHSYSLATASAGG